MSKDFHITLKIKNGRIIQRMRELGIANASQLARLAGVNQYVVWQVLSFKRSPMNKRNWSSAALSISSALRIDPENLWPDHIAILKARNGEIGFYADVEDLKSLPAHDSFVDRKAIESALSTLGSRELYVIDHRYGLHGNGEHTLEEISEDMKITRERVRQIEYNALRKLKRPAVDLIDAVPGIGKSEEDHIAKRRASDAKDYKLRATVMKARKLVIEYDDLIGRAKKARMRPEFIATLVAKKMAIQQDVELEGWKL